MKFSKKFQVYQLSARPIPPYFSILITHSLTNNCLTNSQCERIITIALFASHLARNDTRMDRAEGAISAQQPRYIGSVSI
jgi:hypothetical protein